MEGARSKAAAGTGDAALESCLGQLLGADIAAADRVALDRLVARSQRLRSFLDAVDVKIATRAGELAREGAVVSATDVLANHGRNSKREARKTAARADACKDIPGLADALGSGETSAGHVDAVVTAAAGLDADQHAEFAKRAPEIVEAAVRLPVEQFAREVRRVADDVSRTPGQSRQQRLHRQRTVKRWVDPVTGMCVTQLELNVEGDAKVWTAIRAGLHAEQQRTDGNDGRSLDQQLADVVVNLICGAQALDQRVPEISVLIDADTLGHGRHSDTVSETSGGEPVDVEAVRRLGCDGDLVAIWLDNHGLPLSVGRTRRLATREQHLATTAMYRTCGFPDCIVPVDWCRLHHVAWWTRDRGATDLDNLIPLCSHHHHLIHDDGWSLHLDPDRTVTVHRPDGNLHYTGITANRHHDHREHPPP